MGLRADIVCLKSGRSVGTKAYRSAAALRRHGVDPVVREYGGSCLVTLSNGEQAVLFAGTSGRVHSS